MSTNNSKSFNYEEFKQQAIAKIKQGKGISGKDGVFTPLDHVDTNFLTC